MRRDEANVNEKALTWFERETEEGAKQEDTSCCHRNYVSFSCSILFTTHKRPPALIFLSGQKAAFPGKNKAKQANKQKPQHTQTNKQKPSGKQREILFLLGLDLPPKLPFQNTFKNLPVAAKGRTGEAD